MDGIRVLLVEDDEHVGELQRDFLLQQGLAVLWLKDGLKIDEHLCEFRPHVIVLDLMLPGASGLDICRMIRSTYSGIILFLTSSDDDIDHVASLELGADDFVTKPIRPRVLLARIQMLVRRRQESQPVASSETLSYGMLKLKKISREAFVGDQAVRLSNSEFQLLWLLASHPDKVLERNFLFQQLRGIEFDGLDRSIDTKVVALRKKFFDVDDIPKKIITVRNRGYLFCSDAWE